ncbi:hypothetical protein SDC9_192433 [bioreactor metagenome]|uniref:Uncharacterized protein n=1 Tax=bioreactor metagenome TaxID=1076179 RepID=A0A645I1Y9_9ZZZZ
MALGDAHLPARHRIGDLVGQGQLVQVVAAGVQAHHAGDVAGTDRLGRVAETEDQAGGVGPRLAVQVQPLRQRDHRRFQPLRGGAVGMQAARDLRDEGHALRIRGASGDDGSGCDGFGGHAH